MARSPVGKPRTLTVSAARAYYDRFGRKQDTQGFYEDPALDDLVAHGRFGEAQRVFEFGCGTGRLAARLLGGHLPAGAVYLGCDVSPVMAGLAARRLAAFGARAGVVRTGGAVRFPVADGATDRVIGTYVLDLLADDAIGAFFAEAHRVLAPGGRLCLASLTEGVDAVSRFVASLWKAAFRLRPSLVGGCRPLGLGDRVDPARWEVEHRRVVTPFGVPSEVMVLVAREDATARRG